MRATLLKRAWRTFGHAHFAPQSRGGIVMVALLLAAANLSAAPIVNWVSGGPNPYEPAGVSTNGAGYRDGDTILDAEYHTPCGIAMDSSGNYLFVADRDNNAIRYLDLAGGQTWTFVIAAPSLIRKPIAVALDSSDNVYVLNRGTTNNISTTGTVVEFNNSGDLVAKNATGLINAAGMALDGVGNIYLTVQSNKLIRIAAGTTNQITIATIPNAGASLQGIVVKHNGLIAACDSGRNGIYLIDPATGIVTTNAGFHGRGDFNINGNNIASSSTAKFNQPMNVAETGDGNLIVTDFGNHRVKVVTSTSVTNLYGVSSNNWVYIRNSPYYNWPGFVDGTVVVPDAPGGVAARQPFGVALAPDGNVYVTEDYYHIIRHVTAGFVPPVRPPHPPSAPTELTVTANSGQVILTWTASPGATNYTIKRSTSSGGPYTTIGSTTATSYTDTNVINGMTYYYVVLASNAGGESAISSQVSATPPIAPPPASISFGFASGPGSSKFVASPGQSFFVPVGLSLLPNPPPIYGLQFNVTLTNLGSSVVNPATIVFRSLLGKPNTNNDGYYLRIQPYMFVSTNQPNNDSNAFQYQGGWYQSLQFTNTNNENLLGVGWLEVLGRTNLYNTLSQNLLTFPIVDGTDPSATPNQMVIGAYGFAIPANAIPGDVYQIQIGRPSATTFPGLSVNPYGIPVAIEAPADTNLLGPGSVNALKNVTIGQIKYLVGDVYPANWYNAGDFGSGDLANIDVIRVFDFAAYPIASPPPLSDLFDALDSCGNFGTSDGTGLFIQSTFYNPSFTFSLNDPSAASLFGGNDTNINQIAFGDGVLDVCDVYVTFRRSLDPSLTWFRRYWSGGFRVAEIVPNVVPHALIKPSATVQSKVNASPASTDSPQVNFSASNFLASAGQTIQVPITAQIFGAYPLRVLMLNLTVLPLDGSPALTTAVSFAPNSALGIPTLTDSTGKGNYAATWLDSAISGLTGNTTIGTLTVTIPANATSQSAYAIHFDHASASPNGIASFPKQTLTGLITLSNRSGSSYNDGIPDSWRLRYFLTLNNYLSQTNADADGDGLNNLQEYLAGTDPTDPKSFFKNIGTDPGAAQQPNDCVISWPSASGKQYVIERSPSLASPIWIPVSTNSGTGTIMQFHDSAGGSVRFYRVRVQ
jgi:hypothetical protein